ncbi:MAG: DNA/RNA non-specific endonuclease [Bacteroidales bacterium]|nr:DNA/RNA non-specific endonuclease [Bacteroidales bacterium]
MTLSASFLALVASCTDFDEQGDAAPAAITPRSTELNSDEGSVWVSVTAEGSWTVSLEFGDADGWAAVTPVSGTGSIGNMSLIYQENTGNKARSVTLVLICGNGFASATVTQAGLAGAYYGTLDNGADVAVADWLELPATAPDDGKTFFVHDMDGGKYQGKARSGVRNWSFYWDSTNNLSPWVAYPLNNSLKGNGSRSNLWGFDPLLPAAAQPDVTRTYGGGWTRGHQIPSADRLTTVKANASTFYGTNMTPQNYDFNGEIWAKLEGRVRGYAASSDTLYVVTGCLYNDASPYIRVSSGHPFDSLDVKIPSHYFKALLFRGYSPYATDGFMAAGFLLPHSGGISGGNYLDYIMSIDELEEKTGIDFFPNLIGLLGKDKSDAIEAQAPSNWWK